MTFTDDDLKRLKDGNSRALKLTVQGQKIRARVHLDVEELDAIIARLEAAERCLETANQDEFGRIEGVSGSLYEAWRKAAGK